jgi:hypothetical protein
MFLLTTITPDTNSTIQCGGLLASRVNFETVESGKWFPAGLHGRDGDGEGEEFRIANWEFFYCTTETRSARSFLNIFPGPNARLLRGRSEDGRVGSKPAWQQRLKPALICANPLKAG